MSDEKKNHSKKPRVLVTGAKGFIGSALIEHLNSLGYPLAGMIRKSAGTSDALESIKGKCDIYEADLRDYYGVEAVLRSFLPDIIIHLGAITPVSYSFDHPQEVGEVNYIGTVNLAEAAKKVLPNLQLFSFTSSMEVYGTQDERDRPFVEKINVHPNCPYAVAKHACEKYLEYMYRTYQFPCVMTRQTNCYGRRFDDYFVIEAFITQMLKNPKEVNFGRKEPIRNFIHIDDLVRYHQAIIEKHHVKPGEESPLGQVFNTGPANGLTIGELAENLAAALNWNGKINWNTKELRVGEIFCLDSDPSKAKYFFDWKPELTLKDGIEKTIAYWREKICVLQN